MRVSDEVISRVPSHSDFLRSLRVRQLRGKTAHIYTLTADSLLASISFGASIILSSLVSHVALIVCSDVSGFDADDYRRHQQVISATATPVAQPSSPHTFSEATPSFSQTHHSLPSYRATGPRGHDPPLSSCCLVTGGWPVDVSGCFPDGMAMTLLFVPFVRFMPPPRSLSDQCMQSSNILPFLFLLSNVTARCLSLFPHFTFCVSTLFLTFHSFPVPHPASDPAQLSHTISLLHSVSCGRGLPHCLTCPLFTCPCKHAVYCVTCIFALLSPPSAGMFTCQMLIS